MVRLALLGHGRWGKAIERTLQNFPDVSLTVILRGEEVPRGIDGVIIATPISTHATLALPCIRRKVPVFIEKPLTCSVKDAKLLLTAAAKSKSLVQVGHIHLHNPAFKKVQELAPSLGPIRYVLFEGMNNGPFRNDASVLWDWLPHPLSMALRLFDCNPKCVQAWGINTLRPRTKDLYDVGVVKFDFQKGMLLCVVNWLAPEKLTKVTIVGKNSSLVHTDTAEQKLALYEGMGPAVVGVKIMHQTPAVSFPTYESGWPLEHELRAFVDAIKRGSRDRSGLAFGAKIVELIAAAHNSAQKNGKSLRC